MAGRAARELATRGRQPLTAAKRRAVASIAAGVPVGSGGAVAGLDAANIGLVADAGSPDPPRGDGYSGGCGMPAGGGTYIRPRLICAMSRRFGQGNRRIRSGRATFNSTGRWPRRAAVRVRARQWGRGSVVRAGPCAARSIVVGSAVRSGWRHRVRRALTGESQSDHRRLARLGPDRGPGPRGRPAMPHDQDPVYKSVTGRMEEGPEDHPPGP